VRPDEPTDVMPGGPDEPTEAFSDPGQTEVLSGGEDARATAVPGNGGNEGAETGVLPDGNGNRGIGMLVAAIVASLLLVGAYVAAGGPVGPDKAADPCDPRPWTDPGNLEEAAQQFALSAADGAACELGVSREELTRSIAEEDARRDFMEEHGFSEDDLEDALRAGLNRAVDDAENAGALGGLAATGIRAAIRVMPMSVMIDLLENAETVFQGDLGGVGDAIDAIGEGIDGLGSGTTDNPLGKLGDAIEGALPQGTTDDLKDLIPEETRKQLEAEARDRLERGLNELIGP
jgi:hypothetical protein